jgi:hypothetical protein
MPKKDLMFADRTAFIENIKNQPPNTHRRQLAETTGVPKSAIARVTQKHEKLREEWTLRHGQRRISPSPPKRKH